MATDSCPARFGIGADIQTAEFWFCAEPCVRGSDGRDTLVEIFGYSCAPGQDAAEDVLLTDELTVPVASPIATIALQVQGDPDNAVREVGARLRRLVAACRCASHDECPALSALSLLSAMEEALVSADLGRRDNPVLARQSVRRM